MENKQGKGRLPEWYSEKVNMANDVFSGNPDWVDLSRPHIHTHDSGYGVAAQRKGGMGSTHPASPSPSRSRE